MKDKIETVKRMLQCQLTDREKREFGMKLANLRLNHEETENRKKAAAEQFKMELTAIDLGIQNTAQIIRQEFESLNVECKWVFNYEMGFKDLIRQDTFETVETLGLTQEERQRELDLKA